MPTQSSPVIKIEVPTAGTGDLSLDLVGCRLKPGVAAKFHITSSGLPDSHVGSVVFLNGEAGREHAVELEEVVRLTGNHTLQIDLETLSRIEDVVAEILLQTATATIEAEEGSRWVIVILRSPLLDRGLSVTVPRAEVAEYLDFTTED